MDILITEHYNKEDKLFERDYLSIDIEVDGQLIKEYGDYYHDKGYEKMLGFLDALKYLVSVSEIDPVTITYKKVADGEY